MLKIEKLVKRYNGGDPVLKDLDLNNHSRGVVFTLPLEHIAGIDHRQIAQFEQLIKNDI